MSGADGTVRAASQRAQAALAALLEAWREAGEACGVAGAAVACVLVDAGLRLPEAERLVERLSEVAARGALPAAVGGAHGGEPAAAGAA